MSVSFSSVYGNSNITHSGGKMYVPVASSKLIYSHFDHVSGVAAKKGQEGVSISKIQILNTLIDHLSSIKSGKIASVQKNASPEQIDSLIQNYQTQIKQSVELAQNSMYKLPGNQIQSGLLFSVEA